MIENFDRVLKNASSPIAVAVSGGADSLALLLFAQRWAQKNKKNIIALTVDHGLRPESAAEANRVKSWVTQRGLPHVTLNWEGLKPSTRLQEKARIARYNLLIQWCKANHVSTLLLGHHQEDQEETFWLRLVHGSDLEGLSGMRESWTKDGIRLLRPLLSHTKASLKAFLRFENQEWIEDPSNQSPDFFRGKFRNFLESEGLSSLRLSKTIAKLQESSDFIQHSLHQAAHSFLSLHEEGYLSLQKDGLLSLHPVLSKRLLSLCMQWFSATPYPPRSEILERVREKLEDGKPFTAGNIYWFQDTHDLYLSREKSRIQDRLELKDLTAPTLWDHRFWIDPSLKNVAPQGAYLSSFGAGPKSLPLTGSFPSLPHHLSAVLPAIWVKEELVAVPHLGYNQCTYQGNLRQFISVKPLIHNSLRLTV